MLTKTEVLKKRINRMAENYHEESIKESKVDVEEKFNTDCGPFGKCELVNVYEVFVSVLEGVIKDIEEVEEEWNQKK